MKKKTIAIGTALMLAASLTACGKGNNDSGKDASTDKKVSAAEADREKIYQVALLQSLTFGDYYGSVSVKELKEKGDIGIGTFNGLNGELVMVDGVVYRAAGDGSVEAVADDETIPFSNVTFLDADETQDIKDVKDFDSLRKILDDKVAELGTNRFYMIRIDGNFNTINVRSEYAQKEPYEPLAKVLEHDQTFFDYEDLKGTIVGLYCPPYMADLNATGWHLHFVSDDKSKGGHVLDMNISDAAITWDYTDGFEMLLPEDEMFVGFDLTIDQSEDIEKVEKKAK